MGGLGVRAPLLFIEGYPDAIILAPIAAASLATALLLMMCAPLTAASLAALL